MAVGMTGYSVVGKVAAEPLEHDAWSLVPGAITPAYERPSRFEQKIARTLTNPNGEPRVQNARTRLCCKLHRQLRARHTVDLFQRQPLTVKLKHIKSRQQQVMSSQSRA